MVPIYTGKKVRIAQSVALHHLRNWLPEGRLLGTEYVARNPTRVDRSPGSFKVNVKTGAWSDFATGDAGGDLVSLYAYLNGVSYGSAASLLLNERPYTFARSAPPDYDAQNHDRSTAAHRMWDEAVRISGTPGEEYLRRERGLEISEFEIFHAVRWHWRSYCICANMTEVVTNETVGVHRTFLDRTARKIDRRMLGRQGVIRLSADEDVLYGLGITEGLEDGFAVMQMGWRPVWVTTCSSALAKFRLVRGVHALTIFADADPVGRKAASQCRDRWSRAGLAVRIVLPEHAAHD